MISSGVLVAAIFATSLLALAAVMIRPEFQPVRVALAVYLLAYLATTVVGAALILTPFGMDQLQQFLSHDAARTFRTLGSPVYIALLVAPAIAVPVSAGVFAWLSLKLFRQGLVEKALRHIPVSPIVLYAMTFAALLYCFLKLYWVGSLFPETLVAADSNYAQKILQRTELMGELRFTFYAVVYAVIPMLSVLFFARFIRRGRKLPDLAGAVINYLAFSYLIFAVYLKAPLLILSLMLALAAILAGAKLIFYLPALLVVAIGTFSTMQILMGGLQRPALPPESEITALGERPGQPPLASPEAPDPSAAPAPSVAAESSQGSEPARDHFALVQFARAPFLRMASAFPFYVETFSDPSERCGIETNALPLMPTPKCLMATKIFAEMYPRVTWTTGFAPAPAHISAYGEVGFGYALLVMMATGAVIGIMGTFGTLATGAVSVAINVANCIFAYYATQVPFIGALSYSHGLIVFLLPVAVAGAASYLWLRSTPPRFVH